MEVGWKFDCINRLVAGIETKVIVTEVHGCVDFIGHIVFAYFRPVLQRQG